MSSLLIAYDSMQPQKRHSVIKAQLKRRSLLPHAAAFHRFCQDEGRCTTRLQEDHFRAIVVFAELFSDEGQYKTAEHMLGYAKESPVEASHWRKVAMLRLAENLRNQTLVDGDSRRLKKALRIVSHVEKNPSGVETDLWSTLALLLADRGRFKEAMKYQAMVVGELTQRQDTDHPQTLEARLELSKIQWREGNLEVALKEQKEIEELAVTAGNASALLQVWAALVRTHYSFDDLQTAVDLAEKVVNGRAETFGGLDMRTIVSEKDLAKCLVDLDRTSEAIIVLERVEGKLRQMFDSSHQEVRDCVERLSGIREKLASSEGII